MEKFQSKYVQGVLEAIQIKCAGYPTRKTFLEFLKRFGILAPEILYKVYDFSNEFFFSGTIPDDALCVSHNLLHYYSSDEREASKRLLEKLSLVGYQVIKLIASRCC